MSPNLLAYRAALGLLRLTSPFFAKGEGKLSLGVRGRRRTLDDFSTWSRRERDNSRPLVWFHAPSVGEGLQARAVLEALQRLCPDCQTAFTFFSPSAEGLAKGMPADVTGYLPWDMARDCRRALDLLNPSALVFTKTEIWPVLVSEARRRGIPVVMVAGTLPEDAGRLGGPARWIMGPAWRSLDWVSAISPEDGERFALLGVGAEDCFVDGDPGIDSAAERAEGADPAAPWLAPFHADPRPTLVAGSTWPGDEEIMLPAALAVRERHRDLRVIVAPHEPTAEHLAPLEESLSSSGVRWGALSEVERTGNASGLDVILVDRVGVLAHLYTVGSMAWVGGGFHDAGLHSVLEPAAAGIPILIGPRFTNSLAANDLVGLGGVKVVEGPGAVEAVLDDWLSSPDAGLRIGAIGYRYIERHRGAAQRAARRINALIAPPVGGDRRG